MKKQTIGLVAHVDAGKTTCAEAMLYTAGAIRKLGRVDHKDTVMDYDNEEKDHGITIYAKEAHFSWKDTDFFVIDTPGHVDFSAEMERSLQVLDLAVLIINGQDGVQSHTESIWKCLAYYHVPVVIFINKMDISYVSKEDLLNDLKKKCSSDCIAWNEESTMEEVSLCSDDMLNEYMDTGTIAMNSIQEAVYSRKCFPVLFGSALKLDGIESLLDLLSALTPQRSWPEEFGARVYKISVSDTGERLTHVKMTGGILKAKDKIDEEEKVDQIRLYQGRNYEMKDQAEAGDVVVLKGLESYETGAGLGFEQDLARPLLNAFMDYKLILPQGADVLALRDVCSQLAAEDPTLQVDLDADHHSIHVRIMGAMQMEVLQKQIYAKSGIHVGFDTGSIVYQETIKEGVDGAGHFEPLRHYAEVHVHLEPLPAGSGIVVSSNVSTDELNGTWQRSILNTLERYRHRGVLTGSHLTDVKITLAAGRGSRKHTSGGDFRQASLRAVRQALMKADNILLEPFFNFTLVLPSSYLSRALFDLETKKAKVEGTQQDGDRMIISGKGPVRTLMNYQNDVIAYTRGTGRFNADLAGYEPCEDQKAVIEKSGYDPEADLRNPSGSVFCQHGAGTFVPWNEADEMMHIQLKDGVPESTYKHETMAVSNEDLEAILSASVSNNRNLHKKTPEKKKEEDKPVKVKAMRKLPGLLIVDGYNVIYDWPHLAEIAKEDLYAARHELIMILANYQAYTGENITIVFDGYKKQDNKGTVLRQHNMKIVYTKTDETADAWIERAGYEYKDKYALTVATSDRLIQTAVFSQGALRMSARELQNRITIAEERIKEKTDAL